MVLHRTRSIPIRQRIQVSNAIRSHMAELGMAAVRNGTRRPWLVQLLARRTQKVAAVALANKTAPMVWAIMTSGKRYREPHAV